MKFAATLILLLFLGWALVIQGEPVNAQEQKKKPPSVQQPEPDSKERRPSSPRTFTPSEKISADSAVSFPVDI